jgi:hypothetical protein
LEETADFLSSCASFFKNAHGAKIKHAYAKMFIQLLLPVSAVSNMAIREWKETLALRLRCFLIISGGCCRGQFSSMVKNSRSNLSTSTEDDIEAQAAHGKLLLQGYDKPSPVLTHTLLICHPVRLPLDDHFVMR